VPTVTPTPTVITSTAPITGVTITKLNVATPTPTPIVTEITPKTVVSTLLTPTPTVPVAEISEAEQAAIKAKTLQIEKLKQLTKKLDHLERAKREEELPLLLQQFEKQKKRRS